MTPTMSDPCSAASKRTSRAKCHSAKQIKDVYEQWNRQKPTTRQNIKDHLLEMMRR